MNILNGRMLTAISVLHLIHDHGGLSLTDLAHLLNVSRVHMSHVCKPLTQAGITVPHGTAHHSHHLLGRHISRIKLGDIADAYGMEYPEALGSVSVVRL